jgi:hypothetical protein
MRDPTKGLEKTITEAQAEGKFEDLPGKGKPLVIDTSPDAVIKGLLKEANVSLAPEWARLAGDIDRLLEEEQQLLQRYAATYGSDLALLAAGAGNSDQPCERPAGSGRWWQVVAGWATRKRSARPAAGAYRFRNLADAQRHWDRALERYAGLLHDLNRKIRRFNQLVPLTNRQRAPFAVKERLEAFIERFPRLALAEDGAVRAERSLVPPSLLVPPPEAQDPAARKRAALEAVALQRARRRQPPPIG